MIRPGLFTASMRSADHFGMSADCLLCLSIVVCSFFWFGTFEGSFPLVATEGTRLSAHSAHRRAKRRGALEAQRRVVRMGCRETMKCRGGAVTLEQRLQCGFSLQENYLRVGFL